MNKNPMWSNKRTIELIETIQCNRILYDTEAKNYGNRKIVDNTWSDVDFLMKTPPGTSKEKYQYLRNTFRKIHFNKEQKSNFLFYDQLKFLIPFLRPPNNPENSLERCVERATTEYLKENSGITFYRDTQFVAEQEQEEEEEEMEEVENEDVDFLVDNNSNHSDNKSPKRQETIIRFKMKSNDSRSTSSKYSLPIIRSDQQIKAPSEFRIPQKEEEEEEEVEYLLDEHSNSNHSDNFAQAQADTYPKRKAEIQPEKKVVPKKTKLEEILEPSSSTTTPHLVHSVPAIPVVTQILPQKIYSPGLPPCDCTTDPDAIFLRSLLEDMKTMTRKNKGLFKIKVQQLLQDILYPDD